jgi:hypothetical protein
MLHSTHKKPASYNLQFLLYVLVLFFYAAGLLALPSLLFAAIIQFLLGLVQLLNGLTTALLHRSVVHAKYFGAAVLYLIVLAIGSSFMELPSWLKTIFVVVCWAIVPMSMATWYLNLSKHWQPTATGVDRAYQDDVLDQPFG